MALSAFLAKILHLNNHGYILFNKSLQNYNKRLEKIMTENQYIRANRTVLFTVLIVFNLYCTDPDGSIRSG